MRYPDYNPPLFLQNGLTMTLYTATRVARDWESTVFDTEPIYQQQIFTGANNIPLFGLIAIPKNPRGTIVATYGITGDLEDQWFLRILGRKAYAQGYAIILFDWRAHGKSIELSPTLTSDGLYEGEDYVRIASQAKSLGCPGKFWFIGYSLGGQLALWAGKAFLELVGKDESLGLEDDEIGGVAVICPNLESTRSFHHLSNHRTGQNIIKGITERLKALVQRIHDTHPGSIDPEAIARIDSTWSFDQELIIKGLGFESVEAYYNATSSLYILPHLRKPTLIIYAADDPFFDPAIIPDLKAACNKNPAIDLLLTPHGGHVYYLNSKRGQRQAGDPDVWWAWNRVLQWVGSF